ncbi:MAG: hypothetical protein A3J08_04070 [Candidatus Lloydbacteria bacterium RIFCSPLOWO2_02_FULL_51_11]|uniref:Uncharacterized protein n=1 Tax=Candidatus Lloydbacteria bacterium RIFCSPLOWO2_02_FULL_51_11 TaxID=1798667 RepID=A0A1G2DN71_9BACT|nr:MAG: hypothetical protein A3J08_04070 [Candidatus Lloydbacteria bacterium RIFCSPLOWO2_02_FULL_51_11]
MKKLKHFFILPLARRNKPCAHGDTLRALFHYTKLNTKKHGYRHEITLKKCFVKIGVSIRVY